MPVNTKGRVQGIEVAYQQQFFDHFGMDANYTYTDGKQTEGVVNNDDRLVGTSKNVYNVSGFFESTHFSARVSYNYRSAFYSGLIARRPSRRTRSVPWRPRWPGSLNDNFSVNFDGQNLNNPDPQVLRA